MTKNVSKISHLELVVPPLSSQEAFKLKDDHRAERQMRESDFYMIAGKAAYRFQLDPGSIDVKRGIVSLAIMSGDAEMDRGTLTLGDLPFCSDRGVSDFRFAFTEEQIFLIDGDSVPESERLVNSFTPEGLLWARSRNVSGITGFDRFQQLSAYDLLYAGIAKVGDSYDRLIAKGHEARMNILSNEPQRAAGARVADEIFLFLFRVQPLFLTVFSSDHGFMDDDDLDPSVERKRIVADAEKAFVHLLQPQYNTVKFKNYPKGTDGLVGSGLARYGYTLAEALTFHTPMGRFRGGRHPVAGFVTNYADLIFIEGNHVDLTRSGIDFPEEDR